MWRIFRGANSVAHDNISFLVPIRRALKQRHDDFAMPRLRQRPRPEGPRWGPRIFN